MANWDQRYGLEALTELADNGRLLGGQRIKGGVMGTDINFFHYQPVLLMPPAHNVDPNSPYSMHEHM